MQKLFEPKNPFQYSTSSKMKKILVGIAWFIAFYIGLNILLGIFVYLFSGADYSSFQEGYKYGTEMGTDFVESGGRILFLIISASLSGILTYKGILPGTQSQEKRSNDEN